MRSASWPLEKGWSSLNSASREAETGAYLKGTVRSGPSCLLSAWYVWYKHPLAISPAGQLPRTIGRLVGPLPSGQPHQHLKVSLTQPESHTWKRPSSQPQAMWPCAQQDWEFLTWATLPSPCVRGRLAHHLDLLGLLPSWRTRMDRAASQGKLG